MKDELHEHLCMFPYHESEGCGHRWKHRNNSSSEAQYIRNHTCPKCKRVMPRYGNHYWMHDPTVIQARRDMSEAEFANLTSVFA